MLRLQHLPGLLEHSPPSTLSKLPRRLNRSAQWRSSSPAWERA
jgi:hypothetical protein